MKSHKIRTVILLILGLGVVFSIAVLLGLFRQNTVDQSAYTPLTDEQMLEIAPRGRELVLAGDCLGCHSQAQGPQAAGGVAMATPFGTIYSTNITPDKEHGIGHYTRADFHRVLRDGIAPGDRNLYPAMPFVFTHMTRPEDIDAIYAYIMSMPPLAVPNKENTGAFRLPVRPFMNFWTLLNFPERTLPQNPDQTDQWLRGAYLVEGLAHCAACHTPRNFMMGVDFSKHFEGGMVDGLEVPPITPAALGKYGFDVNTLTHYLQTGIAPQGTSFAGMNTVTHFSTSAMETADVQAMATYLLTDKEGKLVTPQAAPAPLPEAEKPVPDSPLQIGQRTYMAACAGCHGMQGEGIPNVSPAMHGNAILSLDSAHDTISVILNGLPTQHFTGNQRMYAMPPFSHRLSDEDIADVATWIRAEWGGQAEPVTTEQVAKMPRAID